MNSLGLVTGINGYVGKAIAKKLLENDYSLVGTYHSNKNIYNIKNDLKQYIKNNQLILRKLDIRNENEVENLCNDFKFNFLINNAGISKSELAISLELEKWKRVIDTNLTGTYIVSKNVVKNMLMNRINGSIVNISSVIGIRGNKGQVAYAASKAGIIGMMHSFSKEYGKKNIRFNTIAPGYLDNGLTREMSDKDIEIKKSSISLKRFGKAEEIANVVLFLISNDSTFVNDSTIVVDGGGN